LFARLLVGLIGGLLLGIAGAGLCMLAFGADSGYWALLLFWVAGLATAITAPSLVKASRWLLQAAGIGILLLVFSSAVVSDRLLPGSRAALPSPDHQNDTTILLLGMLLGGLALFAGLWIGRDPVRVPKAGNAALDETDSFDGVTPTGSHPILAAAAADETLRRRRWLAYMALPALVLLCVVLLWNAHIATQPALPGTGEEKTAELPVVTPLATAEAETLPAAAGTQPPPVTQPTEAPAITTSAARKECMAQVEAARLFLAVARESSSRGDYEVRIRDELERFKRERPVGPRTLTLISTAMWTRRGAADPGAGVWSREYSQCESTRNSGRYYVVRGGAN
jgi:hypothetical protein